MLTFLSKPFSRLGVYLGWLLLCGVFSGCPGPAGVSVFIPSGTPGIGFDDLGFSAILHKVLVPAGRTGTLALIDPSTMQVTTIGGFKGKADYSGGHDDGPTSVDEGRGLLFVTDRTAGQLNVVDPSAGAIVASSPLLGGPDYVRYVAATSELWVTEPGSEQIEIFSLPKDGLPQPSHTGNIAVKGGPESLVIDSARHLAFTHLWQGKSVAIDVQTRQIVGQWPNTCTGSRGIAVDEKRGFLFAACDEGTTVVLDVDHGGRVLSSAQQGNGVDVIGYNAALSHLYLAAAGSKELVVLGVSAAGQLSVLGSFHTAGGAHCATADDQGFAWVCSPDNGRLLRIKDPYPKAGI